MISEPIGETNSEEPEESGKKNNEIGGVAK